VGTQVDRRTQRGGLDTARGLLHRVHTWRCSAAEMKKQRCDGTMEGSVDLGEDVTSSDQRLQQKLDVFSRVRVRGSSVC
jgi:hypothetical protein